VPKMKSHRGVVKRFKQTPTGKIKRRRAFGNHMLGKKTSQRKRRISSPTVVSDKDDKRIRRMLGGR
jgi:large subunit ribosomal protein L35